MKLALKRQRRERRHRIWKQARTFARRKIGLCTTKAQLAQAATVLTDRWLSEHE